MGKERFHCNFPFKVSHYILAATSNEVIMSRETKTITVVECAKFNTELPALSKPPFPGEMGQRIYDNVSAMAWGMWQEQATLVINHYGLNMADPRANDFLFEQMEAFLFGGDATLPGSGGAPAKK